LPFVLKWIIATLVFLGIGWLSLRYGHGTALAALIAVLLFVAVFGGHGRRARSGPTAPPGPEPPAGE
jgi:hypothetical protein